MEVGTLHSTAGEPTAGKETAKKHPSSLSGFLERRVNPNLMGFSVPEAGFEQATPQVKLV